MYDRVERCPCGNSRVNVVTCGPRYDPSYVVKCQDCGIQCPSHGRDESEAKENWNEWIRRSFRAAGFRD